MSRRLAAFSLTILLSSPLVAATRMTFDIAGNRIEVHESAAEPWRVTLIDTGADTMTGGRLRRVLPYRTVENRIDR